MRTDLEAAMAAVISSRDASDRFADDPQHFGAEFSLTPLETAMLVEMGDDLTSLTTAFVNKRRSALRWNARRTLEMLGDEGEDLLDDFVEENAQTGSFRNDAAAFGDFVIARSVDGVQARSGRRIIVEMARYERHRSDSFWDATARSDVHVGRPHPVGSHWNEKPAAFVLAAGANIGSFDRDVRLAYRRTVRRWDLLPPDPCRLLFFHARRRALLRTVRLRPAEAEVVAKMPIGVAVAVDTVRELALEGIDVDRLLMTLSWEDAGEWI